MNRELETVISVIQASPSWEAHPEDSYDDARLLAEQIIAALSAPARGDDGSSRDHAPAAGSTLDWRDISTAPRDGTRILLCFGEVYTRDNGYVTLGHWDGDGLGGQAWNNAAGQTLTAKATHWMPLPAPPPDGATSAPHGETADAQQLSYQTRVMDWMGACFGDDITNDPLERVFRFWEEAFELGQALGATEQQGRDLLAYTFSRSRGEVPQEIGGVMVCIAALCGALGQDMDACGETELARVWTKVEAIRAKHAAKPKDVRSSLPGYAPPLGETADGERDA